MVCVIFVIYCKIKEWVEISISIDEKEEVFYSFNTKGFTIEKPKKYIPKLRQQGSLCIRMKVTEEIHKRIAGEIEKFLNRKDELKYSNWWME